MRQIKETSEGLEISGSQGKTVLVYPPNSQTDTKYIDVGNIQGGGGEVTAGTGIAVDGSEVSTTDPWDELGEWTVVKIAVDESLPNVTTDSAGDAYFYIDSLSLTANAVGVVEWACFMLLESNEGGLVYLQTVNNADADFVTRVNFGELQPWIGGGSSDAVAVVARGRITPAQDAPLPATASVEMYTYGDPSTTIQTGLTLKAGSLLAYRSLQ